MSNNAVGQIICECGHVAEIRRRKNGQKLPFKACKHCGVQQGKAPVREKWLAEMQESIGVYGEKPANTSDSAEPEQSETLNQDKVEDKNDWTPPAELKPETAEPAPAQKPEPAPKSSNFNGVLIGGGVVAGLLLVGMGLMRGKPAKIKAGA